MKVFKDCEVPQAKGNHGGKKGSLAARNLFSSSLLQKGGLPGTGKSHDTGAGTWIPVTKGAATQPLGSLPARDGNDFLRAGNDGEVICIGLSLISPPLTP